MSNVSGVEVQQQQQYSIVEYVGYNEGGLCGYCHREEASSISIGILLYFFLGIGILMLSVSINFLKVSCILNF